MRKLPKRLFDEFLHKCRKYWLEDENIYDETYLLAKELEYLTGVKWLAWKDFANAFLYPSGLERFVTNEQIYEILKILGWEVVDE